MTVRSRASALVAIVMGGLLLAGCGVPVESKARPIATDDEVTTATAATTPPGSTGKTVELYFVLNGKLREEQRTIEKGQNPNLNVAVEQLLNGPTKDEQAKGLLSSISPETSAIGVTVKDDLATVNLSEQFKPTGDLFVQAAAQIVYTVIANSEATRVRFERDGMAIQPPTDTGGNRDVVTKSDYLKLAS